MSFRVLSFEIGKEDPFSDYPLEHIRNLKLRSIGRFDGRASGAGKIMFYIRGIAISVCEVIRHKGLIYIYYPGHFPMIAGLLGALLKKPYALYVRGVWNAHAPTGVITNYIFRNASFIFTTGIGFSNTIKTVNQNVEPVYPMTAFDTETAVVDPLKDNNDLRSALFIGHIRERKGVLDAVRSVAYAKEQGVDVDLKIVGGGDPGDIAELNKLVHELRLDEQVEYLGHVSEVDRLSEYYRGADVFIYPSYYPEGFPRVVFEAMLFGLPVICTILPGMRGFVENHVNCLEVRPQSPDSIAKAIIQLKKDAGLREEIATAGLKAVREYFRAFKVKGHASQFYEKWIQVAEK